MADRWNQHYETIDVALRPYFAGATTISNAGENTVYQPTPGLSMFLQYLCLSADPDNAGSVTFTVKIGGAVKYRVSLLPGAIWARNIGAGKRALRGAVDQPLVVELSAGYTVHVSLECEDL